MDINKILEQSLAIKYAMKIIAICVRIINVNSVLEDLNNWKVNVFKSAHFTPLIKQLIVKISPTNNLMVFSI